MDCAVSEDQEHLVAVGPLLVRLVGQVDELRDYGGEVGRTREFYVHLGVAVHHHQAIDTECLDLLLRATEWEAVTDYVGRHGGETQSSTETEGRDAFVKVIVE